jgi:hypothetical protein
MTIVITTPHRLAAAALGPLILSGSYFMELLINFEN